MNERYVTFPIILALAGCFDAEPEPSAGESLDLACENEHVEHGKAALAQLASCQSDADCIVASNSSGCVTPFICFQAIARGNEAALEALASAEAEAYLADCGNFCAVADCVGVEQLRAVCDLSIGQCALDVLPFEYQQ